MAWKPTIRDIAFLADVSKSTVSRVLNASPNVDLIIRERVWHMIAERDFAPDRTAMQLALIHTHSPQHLITLPYCGLPIVMINTTAARLAILSYSAHHDRVQFMRYHSSAARSEYFFRGKDVGASLSMTCDLSVYRK